MSNNDLITKNEQDSKMSLNSDNEKHEESGEKYKNKKYEIDGWEDDALNLKVKLLKGIYSHGFENPSPIQKKCLYPMSKYKHNGEHCDILAQAQSGTGKTGGFVISTLERIDETKKATQSIILAPTHELASQIKNVTDSIGSYMSLETKLLIGGTSVEDDRNYFSKNTPHIVVGTPGRVKDMIERKALKTNKLILMVLDEVDEMMSKGFKVQILDIFQHMPEKVQLGFFSATMPEIVKELINRILQDPIKILVKAEQLTLQGIKQYYVQVYNDNEKYATLKDLFANLSIAQSIIYCNSTNRVDDLFEAMTEDGFPVGRMHGKLPENVRNETSKKFRRGTERVLICSDLYARGIDVQQVSIVINFDIPKDESTYLHRIGRSGRWGRKGLAINFKTKYDRDKLLKFERYYDTQIDEMPNNYAKHIDL